MGFFLLVLGRCPGGSPGGAPISGPEDGVVPPPRRRGVSFRLKLLASEISSEVAQCVRPHIWGKSTFCEFFFCQQRGACSGVGTRNMTSTVCIFFCLLFAVNESGATYTYGGSSSSLGDSPSGAPMDGVSGAGDTGGTTSSEEEHMSVDDTSMGECDAAMGDPDAPVFTPNEVPLSLYTGPSPGLGVHYTHLSEFTVHWRAAAHSHFQEWIADLSGNAILTPAHSVCPHCASDAASGVEMFPLDSSTWTPAQRIWDDTVRVAASLLHSAFRHVLGRTGHAPWPLVSFSRRFAVANGLVRKYGGGCNPSLGHPPPAHFREGGVPAAGPFTICAIPLTCVEGVDFVSMIFQAHKLLEMTSHVGFFNAKHALHMGRVFNGVVWSRRALASGGVILASFA